MTQTNGGFSIIWPQLVYALPIILVSIAAVVVCAMNWHKAPNAALFCLIGFGLIGFNSIFGTIITALVLRSGRSGGTLGEILSIVSAVRILFSVAGYIFLLIAVFNGRGQEPRPSLFESKPPQSGTTR